MPADQVTGIPSRINSPISSDIGKQVSGVCAKKIRQPYIRGVSKLTDVDQAERSR